MAETAASLVVLIALGVLIIFVASSMSYAYLVRAGLSEASRFAARKLAVAYGANPQIASNRAQQEVEVFDKIRMNNIVVSSEQFDDAVFDTTASERSVTVRVRYSSNQYGLPPFPLPDPLQLKVHPMVAQSTYRLE
jgi:hypothetical protein